jgi:hypothetical protein
MAPVASAHLFGRTQIPQATGDPVRHRHYGFLARASGADALSLSRVSGSTRCERAQFESTRGRGGCGEEEQCRYGSLHGRFPDPIFIWVFFPFGGMILPDRKDRPEGGPQDREAATKRFLKFIIGETIRKWRLTIGGANLNP